MTKRAAHRPVRYPGRSTDWRPSRRRFHTRLRRILTALGETRRPGDLATRPGYRLHPLKGDMAGLWSVRVSGNWRVVFRFEDSEAVDVDLVDYH